MMTPALRCDSLPQLGHAAASRLVPAAICLDFDFDFDLDWAGQGENALAKVLQLSFPFLQKACVISKYTMLVLLARRSLCAGVSYSLFLFFSLFLRQLKKSRWMNASKSQKSFNPKCR